MSSRLRPAMAAVLAAALCWSPAGWAGTADGIPPFSLKALDGHRYTEQVLKGHPALVVFWAPWCPVCRVELPEVHALDKRFKGRGLRVIGIAFADSERDVRDYVRSRRRTFTFPVLYDAGNRAARRFGVMGAPTIYLFDRAGRQRLQTWLVEDPRLDKALKGLFAPDKALTRNGSGSSGNVSLRP